MQSESAIADRWLNAILRTYPSRTARFFIESQDPMQNPIGHAFQESLEILVRELFGSMDASRVGAALERIVEIRAVEDSTPQQALAFIFELKEILREERTEPPLDAYLSRIDEIALMAFGLYVKCRERICELRASEAKRRVYVLERQIAASEQAGWPEGSRR